MKRSTTILSAIAGIIVVVAVVLAARRANYYWGADRLKALPVTSGNFHPDTNRHSGSDSDSELRERLLTYWSSRPLPDWTESGKVTAPRIILACLLKEKRIREVNRYLRAQRRTGTPGSRWTLNPDGDYDFTLMALMPVLYLFGERPDLLYPETLKHLIDNLLITGVTKFKKYVPNTLGLVEDTENHLLMANGSYYLTNRWLRLHGYKKTAAGKKDSGLQGDLFACLLKLLRCGVYEFNSDPYEGYTLSALLNLQAFAEDSIKVLANKILDRLNWAYAFGSYSFNSFPPFRRRYDRADRTALQGDYQGAMMKVWASFSMDSLNVTLESGRHQALWAAVMPYRPPGGVIRLATGKKKAYYVKIGHGWNSSPEIYSAGPGYLLSAGGVNRGKRSMIIARPTVLITDAREKDLQDVFHLEGPGKDFMAWNNTGVYKNFACAAGPVSIPADQRPLAENLNWKIFPLAENVYLAVYSTNHLGIMAICRSKHPKALLDTILFRNPDEAGLTTSFHHPDGDRIEYELGASHDKWVITAVNHEATKRAFDNWPFFHLRR